MEFNTLQKRFWSPIHKAFSKCITKRECKVLDDEKWVEGGVHRVLESMDSGRDFLQWIGGFCSNISTYFESLKSKRRLKMITEVAESVADQMSTQITDRIEKEIPSLIQFDIYAGDGHFHGHAVHDKPYPGDDRKFAVGHLYGLNLRTNALVHLDGADQKSKKKEHDMAGLKRIGAEGLRLGAKKGRKVIWIWDRAGIDFRFWENCKNTKGVYFISREKENMNLKPLTASEFDPSLPENRGVVKDELCETSQGVMVRRVEFKDPISGETYVFITSIMDRKTVVAGVIAQLYRMRWDIEKVFDEVKNKLHEKKAWATSENAKNIQAKLITITLNAIHLFEDYIAKEEGIENKPEKDRRKKRMKEAVKKARKNGSSVSSLYKKLNRATQTSVKFIRWIRYHVFSTRSEEAILEELRRFYSIK